MEEKSSILKIMELNTLLSSIDISTTKSMNSNYILQGLEVIDLVNDDTKAENSAPRCISADLQGKTISTNINKHYKRNRCKDKIPLSKQNLSIGSNDDTLNYTKCTPQQTEVANCDDEVVQISLPIMNNPNLETSITVQDKIVKKTRPRKTNFISKQSKVININERIEISPPEVNSSNLARNMTVKKKLKREKVSKRLSGSQFTVRIMDSLQESEVIDLTDEGTEISPPPIQNLNLVTNMMVQYKNRSNSYDPSSIYINDSPPHCVLEENSFPQEESGHIKLQTLDISSCNDSSFNEETFSFITDRIPRIRRSDIHTYKKSIVEETLMEVTETPDIITANDSILNSPEKESKSCCENISLETEETSVPKEPDSSNQTKRILRKRIRPLENDSEKGSKKKKFNIQQYYCDRTVKRLPSTLETIFEEPNREQIMSKKRLKRVLDFYEDAGKSRKRHLKAKKLNCGKKFLSRKKISLDLFMKNITEDSEIE